MAKSVARVIERDTVKNELDRILLERAKEHNFSYAEILLILAELQTSWAIGNFKAELRQKTEEGENEG